ncbi:MAG TPA: toll/interleukin-1 receptor domain-containing protein [Casimicrobiaceae bacterium]|jgi:hypothetical protein
MPTDNAPTPPPVFISFCGNDNESWRNTFKEELQRRLKWPDANFFFSESDPILHGDLKPQLAAALDHCTCLVAIVGDDYLDSEWCRFELAQFFGDARRTARRSKFLAVCTSKSAFEGIERWQPWVDARLEGMAKYQFFSANGKRIPGTIVADDGRALVNEAFGDRIVEIAKVIKSMVDAPIGQTANTVDIVIGAATKATADMVGNLEAALRQDAATSALSLRRLTVDDIANDNADDSAITALLASSKWFIVPYCDEEPQLGVLGAGGHLAYEQRCFQRARDARGPDLGARMMWWEIAADPAQGRRAQGKNRDFLNGVKADAHGVDDVVNLVTGRSVPLAPTGQIAKIVIESNTAEYIGPEPLKRRIEQVWKDLQNEVPSARGVALVTSALSVPRMRDLKAQLGADAVIILWGNKAGEAVWAQVDNVDRACRPNKRFIAYLAPPNPEKLDDDYLGWEIVPFHVVESPAGASAGEKIQAVLEFDRGAKRLPQFLAELAGDVARR